VFGCRYFWDNLGHFGGKGLWACGHFLNRLGLRRLKFIAIPPQRRLHVLPGPQGHISFRPTWVTLATGGICLPEGSQIGSTG
jgi:hypothetical protein